MVRPRAVDLDREVGIGPVGIELVAGDIDVELRLGKGVVSAEPLQSPFGLAAQEVGLGLVGGQDPTQAVAADPARQPREGPLDGIEVEDPPHLRLVHGLGQTLVAEAVSEVHQCASDARDGNAADDRSVLVVDETRAVDDDAVPVLPSVAHGDVEQRRRGQQSLEGASRTVTQKGAGPAREHRREAPGVGRQAGMANRVDARVERLQPLALHPPSHAVPREPERRQLRPRHHPMLAAGQGGQGNVGGVIAAICVICATFDTHTRIVARRGPLGCCRSSQDAHAAVTNQAPRPSKAAIASAAEG